MVQEPSWFFQQIIHHPQDHPRDVTKVAIFFRAFFEGLHSGARWLGAWQKSQLSPLRQIPRGAKLQGLHNPASAQQDAGDRTIRLNMFELHIMNYNNEL